MRYVLPAVIIVIGLITGMFGILQKTVWAPDETRTASVQLDEPGPVIVIDFGTATTYDIVGPNGTFEGAVIAPGIRISAQALTGQAAMLPAIEIKKPDSIIAKETISSMQAGIVFGQIGQTEYIVRKIKEESGYLDAKVIASGGLGKMIAAETDIIDIYDSQLTLKGLRIIYEKNKK